MDIVNRAGGFDLSQRHIVKPDIFADEAAVALRFGKQMPPLIVMKVGGRAIYGFADTLAERVVFVGGDQVAANRQDIVSVAIAIAER